MPGVSSIFACPASCPMTGAPARSFATMTPLRISRCSFSMARPYSPFVVGVRGVTSRNPENCPMNCSPSFSVLGL